MGYKAFGSPKGSRVFGVRIACYKAAHQRHTVLLVLGKDVTEKMDWMHGVRVEIATGDGKQAGWLRLKTSENGYALYHTGKGHAALSLSLMRLADDHTHSMESAPHKIKSGALYVRLPEWAKV